MYNNNNQSEEWDQPVSFTSMAIRNIKEEKLSPSLVAGVI